MAERAPAELKRLEWIGSSKKDLKALPEEVIDVFGYALYLAQAGEKHEQAKPLRGFRVGGRSRSHRGLARRYLSRGLHSSACSPGVCVARISKEVEVWNRDTQTGYGFDQGKTESGRQTRKGAGR